MKFLIGLALVCSSAAFAADLATVDSSAGTNTIETAQVIETAVDGLAPLRQTCEAHTVCYSGRRIYCNAAGGSCTAREYPHRAVECVAYDFPGYRGGSRRSGDRCP